MKRYLYKFVLPFAFFLISSASYAQQVNTLYFLENAPMRHIINPAFQPVSDFYMTFPGIGYTSLWAGNNALSFDDLVFTNEEGSTITALHPTVEGQLWNKLPEMLMVDVDAHVNLFSFGFRVREKGYAHLNISERITAGAGVPKSVFGTLLNPDLNNLDFKSINASAFMYTDIAIGYSHQINEHWAVGVKLKALLGHTYIGGNFNELNFTSSEDLAQLSGNGTIQQAGIISDVIAGKDFELEKMFKYLIPTGYGGAVDLGLTYKPFKNLQITAAVSDLGMIHWNKGSIGSLYVDTTFTGLGDFVYEDYIHNDEFQMDSLTADISNNLQAYTNALHITDITQQPFNQLLSATLNVGIDANFWENRIGIGVYSRTRFHNNSVSEEVTLGAALRPSNWFNLAASYSFINGKWSNIGAAISFAPYDAFMFTLAADYVPLSYADYSLENGQVIPIPYKTRGVNVAFGIAIIAGTNAKKKVVNKDKVGIPDYEKPFRDRVAPEQKKNIESVE